ncbi:MAG: hypothetical protein K5752_03760 [Succinivibrionaceae bacterium]|jgi:uncharacterized Zn finger protein|nr:hypothetical protein [Succinivibrionaceae bacterium]
MKVELKCLKCGSNEFANAQNKLFKDGQHVQCLKCGAVFPFEELKKAAVEAAIEQYVKANKQQILQNAETVTDEKELKDLKQLKEQNKKA